MSTIHWAGLAGLAGVASHSAIFIWSEHDGPCKSIPKFYLAAEVVLLATVLKVSGFNALDGRSLFFAVNVGYWLGLSGSILLYRTFLHPLRSIPGPPLAKLSAFWSVAQTVPDFNFHQKTYKMHQIYGDFVRIRPREISINNTDSIRDIHGPGSACNKGPWYDNSYPAGRSIQCGTRHGMPSGGGYGIEDSPPRPSNPRALL
ncbi:uncharacterized protein BDV17DRAFT_19892 [Aspergillus undulatus]|uniref:uncharacterized protein n=1 Tax=Aspergillus undulatus TaxID=1810928 RepID=UPI003CCCF367